MRILHVNKFQYRRGGAEAYMEDVAELQVRSGHDVAFFGMEHPLNRPNEYAEFFPARVDFDPPPMSLAGRVRGIGRMMYSSSARRGIERVVEAFAPDVVHLHNIYHQLSPSVLKPLARRGIPAVMTLHDYKLACPTYLFLDRGQICEACLGGRFYNAALRRCRNGSLGASAVQALEAYAQTATNAYEPVRVFVCPSRFMAAKMTEAGVFPDRLRIVNHFVDAAPVSLKQRPGGGVLYVGRLSSEKGADLVIEAVGLMGASTSLDIAGDGPARAELEALAAQVAPGRVRFHGLVPRDRVFDLLREAAVVALPSRCYENQPMIVLEAFAAGVPVVGANHGGIPELIDPASDGALVPPGDARALAAALARFVHDPDHALAAGRAGRTKVERDFAPTLHLSRLEAIYDEAARRVKVAR